jgi:hypothetical protein
VVIVTFTRSADLRIADFILSPSNGTTALFFFSTEMLGQSLLIDDLINEWFVVIHNEKEPWGFSALFQKQNTQVVKMYD